MGKERLDIIVWRHREAASQLLLEPKLNRYIVYIQRHLLTDCEWVGVQVIHFPYPLYVGDVVGEVTGLAKGSGKWMREGRKEGMKEGGGAGKVGRTRSVESKQHVWVSLPASASSALQRKTPKPISQGKMFL